MGHNYVAQGVAMHQYRAQLCRSEFSTVAVHQYRAQLNRFTTLSSPGSQGLPPGLPAYVNPQFEHQENMKYEPGYILHFCQAGGPSCFADYFGSACLQPGGGVSSVGLRDTVCKAYLRFMPYSKSFAPVQWVTSLFLYFKAFF